MIRINNLDLRYNGTKSRKTLDNISLSLDGEKAAIVGPNGSGKTSLLKAMLGLAPITSGSVNLENTPLRKISNMVSVSTNLPDVYRLMSLKIRDLIEVYADIKDAGASRAFKLIEEFGFDHILNRYIYHLSSGEQKMACNIMAMSFSPDLLLLDEPFDNVDQGRRMKLAGLLNKMNCDIIMNTHEFEVIKRLEGWSLYFMIEGRIFGKFSASQLPNLYINKGLVEGHISKIETSFGEYSITEKSGEVPLSGARNLSTLFEEVA